MNEDLITPTTFGSGEAFCGWPTCWVRSHREELDLVSGCVVFIFWALQKRLGRLLINCCRSLSLSNFSSSVSSNTSL